MLLLKDQSTNGEIYKACLRLSPRFRLVSFDELEERERSSFISLSEEPDFYGVLIPPSDSALPVRSVSRDAALLFEKLRLPSRVPHLLSSLFGSNVDAQVRQLIVDGVLEIESDGKFLSGSAAFQKIEGILDPTSNYIVRISGEAITYASSLEGVSAFEIAARLYMFNRLPSTARLQRRFATPEDVLAFLIGQSRETKALISDWVADIVPNAWIVWRSSHQVSPLPFKLYISPMVEALPETFQLTVNALARTKCTCFKVGVNAFQLLRPDKLIAYYARLENLQEAAELLGASAANIPAHSVPFTASIDSEGLISWGMDPPRFEKLVEYQAHQSWRLWIAHRLAIYIINSKESGAENAKDFALRRLEMDGVDTATWTPNLAIWKGLGGFSEELA